MDGFEKYMGEDYERAQSKIKYALDRCPPHENKTIYTTIEELWK
jgi:hypothetical protein